MEYDEYDGVPLQDDDMVSGYYAQQQQQLENLNKMEIYQHQQTSYDQFNNLTEEYVPNSEDETVFTPHKVINTPLQDLELLRKLKLDILAGVYPQFVRSRPSQSFQDRLDKLNQEQEQELEEESYDSIPLPIILPSSLPARPSFVVVDDNTSLPLNTDTSMRMSIHANREIHANGKKVGKKMSVQKETRGQMKDREARELLAKKELLRQQAEEEALLVARKEAEVLADKQELEVAMEYSDSDSIDGDELMITTVSPLQDIKVQKLNVNAPEFHANNTSFTSVLSPSFPAPPTPASDASSHLTSNLISTSSHSPSNSLSRNSIPTGPRILKTSQASPKLSSTSIPLGPRAIASPRLPSRNIPAPSTSNSTPSFVANNVSRGSPSQSTSILHPPLKDKLVIDDRWGKLVARNTAEAVAANGGTTVQSRHSISNPPINERRLEPISRDDRRSFDDRSYSSTSYRPRPRSRSPPMSRGRSRSPPVSRGRSRSPPIRRRRHSPSFQRSHSPPPFRMRSRSPPPQNSSFNSPRSLPDIDNRYASRQRGRSREPIEPLPLLRRDDRFAQQPSSPNLLNRRLDKFDTVRPLTRSGSDSRLSLSNGSTNSNIGDRSLYHDRPRLVSVEQQRSGRSPFEGSNSPRLARALSPRGHFDDRARQAATSSVQQAASNILPRTNNSLASRAPPSRLQNTNFDPVEPRIPQDSQPRPPTALSQHFGFVQDQEFKSQQEYDERERRDSRFASVVPDEKNSSRQPSNEPNDNRFASPVYFPLFSSAPSNQTQIAPLSARLSVGLEGSRSRNVGSQSPRPVVSSAPALQSRIGSNMSYNKNSNNSSSNNGNNSNHNNNNNGHSRSFSFNNSADTSGRQLGSHNVGSNPSSKPPPRGMNRNGNNGSGYNSKGY